MCVSFERKGYALARRFESDDPPTGVYVDRLSGVGAAGELRQSEIEQLAEDGAVNQLLVKRLLERAGHTVTVVDTGAQAVEALARAHYDIVLMDIQMQDMDGFEATASIRASEASNGRRVPVIALTAAAMEGDRERCLAAGMDGYMSKPIRADALFALLAEHTGS
jgi:CheY-like chemotaxis protein